MNLRLQHLLGAAETRPHGRVHGASFDGDAKSRRGQNRILLRVHANAQVVPASGRIFVAIRAAMASAVEAIGHVLWRAVISGGNDSAVQRDDRADPASQAVRPFPYGNGDAHQVFIHVGTMIRAHTVLRVSKLWMRMQLQAGAMAPLNTISRASVIPTEVKRILRNEVEGSWQHVPTGNTHRAGSATRWHKASATLDILLEPPRLSGNLTDCGHLWERKLTTWNHGFSTQNSRPKRRVRYMRWSVI